ncbi:MAG: LVIVD repeat-containing protein [Saprospiraceae bacterium]
MKQLSLFILAGFLAIGFTSCEKSANSVTVTYQEATAVYGDLDAVRSQPLNAAVRPVEDPGKVFVGQNFILLGEEEKGVHVINNADISDPQFVNFINIPGNREFYVKGNFLYAESYYDLIKLDVSDLNNIKLVDRAENIFQETLTNDNGEALLGFSYKEVSETVDKDTDLYSEIMDNQFVYYDFARNIIPKSAVPSSFAGNSNDQSGTVNRVTVNQDHVYVINSINMSIVDNNDFQLVDRKVALREGAETVFPYEDKLFVGGRTSMNIYDAANPKQPEEVFEFTHATSCDPVLATEDVAYVTLRTADFSDCPGDINALIVLDIESLSNTSQVNEIAMQSPYGMTVVGDRLFVGEGENGLSIFDITDKKNPELIKKDSDVTAYDIIAHPADNNLILVAGTDGLSQYTIDGTLDLSINSRIDY